MNIKNHCKPLFYLLGGIVSVFTVSAVQSCGKAGNASPAGLNIQYEVLNLSPDFGMIDLFVNFAQVNSSPFVFAGNPGYFYTPSTDTPYQFRQAITTTTSGGTIFSRGDILKTGLKYSLFISGARSDNSVKQTFTIDTASLPSIGHGKLRFVNVSPTATSGLDVFANGTAAFKGVTYTNVSKFIELPVGNYDIQVNTSGTASVLKDIPIVTIADGHLYTLYAYGYTSRIDSAAFNAAMITNQ